MLITKKKLHQYYIFQNKFKYYYTQDKLHDLTFTNVSDRLILVLSQKKDRH